MPATALVTALVEQSLNHWLSLSKQQTTMPSQLAGKQFAVTIKDIKLTLVFVFSAQGNIDVIANSEHADCHLSCRLETLQKLEDTSQLTALIKSGELDLDGDIHVAQHFADWLKQSLNRWQDVLASIVGDIACYKLTHAGEQVKAKLDHKVQQDREMVRHWLFDEKQLAAHPIAVTDFADQVNQLRQDTDRLSARIAQLSSQINQ
ncbi:SCP2 sterol-binding domain-containing protein [Catenovulum sp. SM1970]|uniref:ubiquinone biosynthesis accessory factor UbiJ n=1 Tax=Marinifaba aquimaris TaxID=2741323 RepID=UPI0015742656|nr:SCP2 sterol-binding domain-containing protein [Marinifaba aquimaris]NTS77455.1 SCP2 sterol-binding domain-containing protein [Marinifaba aquimaris]